MPEPSTPEPACAWCGRPGDHPPCCATHAQPMCQTCRDLPGSYQHREPPR